MTLRQQRILFICAFAAGLIISLFVYFRFNAQPQPAQDYTPLLAMPLSQLKGPSKPLNAWKGKVLVINFWATWCAPCKKEIPELIKLRQEWANRNVEFIGIAVDFQKDVQEFVDRTPIPYPILLAPDEGAQLMQGLGNTQSVLPFTIILDPTQHTLESITGIVQPSDLRERLSQTNTIHNH